MLPVLEAVLRSGDLRQRCRRVLLGTMLGSASALVGAANEADVAHVRAFDLPESSYLSAETRAALDLQRRWWAQTPPSTCPALDESPAERLAAVRNCLAEESYRSPLYLATRERYPVDIAVELAGGVTTEVFTPRGGVAPRNRHRVLINLHGGGFLEGARSVSHLESIPIAAVARIKVISIDYRMAPEARFPAATDDVIAVYRQLLSRYRAQDIGIYGCSAGALLTAQSVARLLKDHLPLPGAVGMFCMGASYVGMGDSSIIAHALDGTPMDEFAKYLAYFETTRPEDTLAFPVRSDAVMSAFPPSLLVTATRDHALSSVVQTHARLVALGVPTELHVFEGLGHGFFYNPELPESREMYALVAAFFDAHLGGRGLRRR
jgi:monoterpene epsilon-lactone hydrolase